MDKKGKFIAGGLVLSLLLATPVFAATINNSGNSQGNGAGITEGFMGGKGNGRHMKKGMGGMKGGMGKEGATVLAKILGKTEDEILTQSKTEKKTMSKIALENKVLDKYKEALIASAKEKMDKLVADGKITAEQAKTKLDNMTTKINGMTGNEEFKEKGMGGMKGGMKGGMGREGATVLAKILGKTEDEILTQSRTEKKTLSKIALDNKVLDKYKEALIASAKEKMDKLVADGKITAEQAKTKLDNMTTKINGMTGNENFSENRNGHDKRGKCRHMDKGEDNNDNVENESETEKAS